jgi:hypothetical protein
LNGFPADQRWREAAYYWNFAILRVVSDGYTKNLSDQQQDALRGPEKHRPFVAMIQHGLDELGKRTGHPELSHVPLVLTGYSRFSGPVIAAADAFPDRTLGLITWTSQKSSAHNPTFQRTPSMLLLCGWENIYHGGNKVDLMPPWQRGMNIPRMAAVTWRVYHNPHNRHDLGAIFIDNLIQQRIPSDWDPKQGPAPLQPIDLATGWFGDQSAWYVSATEATTSHWQQNENLPITPAANDTGAKPTASWLLNEQVAWAWRAHNARNPQVMLTSPGQPTTTIHEGTSPPPTGYQETGVRLGKPFSIEAVALSAEVTSVEFFANTTSLGASGTFTGGEMALGSHKYATVRIETQIDQPGCYAIMARYTLADGRRGWSRCFPLFVHPE